MVRLSRHHHQHLGLGRGPLAGPFGFSGVLGLGSLLAHSTSDRIGCWLPGASDTASRRDKVDFGATAEWGLALSRSGRSCSVKSSETGIDSAPQEKIGGASFSGGINGLAITARSGP